jgi:hypothetical protein
MKKVIYDKASRRYTFIAFLEIIVLAFLILVSIAGATQKSSLFDYKGDSLLAAKKTMTQ